MLHTILYLLLFYFLYSSSGSDVPNPIVYPNAGTASLQKPARSFPCISSHPHPHRSESRNGFLWLELSSHSLSPPTRDRSETCVHLFPQPQLCEYIIIDASESHHHRSFLFCTSHHPHKDTCSMHHQPLPQHATTSGIYEGQRSNTCQRGSQGTRRR